MAGLVALPLGFFLFLSDALVVLLYHPPVLLTVSVDLHPALQPSQGPLVLNPFLEGLLFEAW